MPQRRPHLLRRVSHWHAELLSQADWSWYDVTHFGMQPSVDEYSHNEEVLQADAANVVPASKAMRPQDAAQSPVASFHMQFLSVLQPSSVE